MEAGKNTVADGGEGVSPAESASALATAAADSSVVGGDCGQSASGDVTPPDPAAHPIEIKLFVGRVPRSFEEENLRPIFEEFGPVLEVAVLKDKGTQQHKGSAFVRMASLTHADASIRSLNDIKVLDQSLGAMNVRYATREAEKFGFSPDNGAPGVDQVKLFVGSLSRTITEAEVKAVFTPYGKIDEVFLLKDSTSGLNKGCAFVKFAYKEAAVRAIRQLNGAMTVPGAPRPIEVRVAESKKSQQQQQQQQVMGGLMGRPMGAMGGMGGMQPLGNAAAANNANPRQGGTWKEYFTQEGRAYYHNSITNMTQWDRPAEFDQLAVPPVAAPPPRPGSGMGGLGGMGGGGGEVTGPPGANIFVFHIPNDWTQLDLTQNFGHFGSIVSARIATDKTTNQNKGYAFVSYDNIHAAAQAVMHMNGFVAGGKRLKVSIKQNEDKYVAHLLPSIGAAAGSSVQTGANGVQQQQPQAQTQYQATGFQQATQAMQAGGPPMYPGALMGMQNSAAPVVPHGMGVMNPNQVSLGGFSQAASPGGMGQLQQVAAQQYSVIAAPPPAAPGGVPQQPTAAAAAYNMTAFGAYGGAVAAPQAAQRYSPY